MKNHAAISAILLMLALMLAACGGAATNTAADAAGQQPPAAQSESAATPTPAPTPAPPAPQARREIQRSVISTGNHRSYAIMADGRLMAWGANAWGSLGDGTEIDRHSPVHIMDDVVDVNALARMAVTADDSLWTWGRFGSNQSDPIHSPFQIRNDIADAVNIGISRFALTTGRNVLGFSGSPDFPENYRQMTNLLTATGEAGGAWQRHNLRLSNGADGNYGWCCFCSCRRECHFCAKI